MDYVYLLGLVDMAAGVAGQQADRNLKIPSDFQSLVYCP